MACKCATKEELDRLYNAYSVKQGISETKTLSENILGIIYALSAVIGWVIIFPLMFVYMLLFVFWYEPGDRKINVQNFNLLKIFHLGKYARK